MDYTWQKKISVNFLYFMFPSFWNFNVWLSIHNMKKKDFKEASDFKIPRTSIIGGGETGKCIDLYNLPHKVQKSNDDEEIKNP